MSMDERNDVAVVGLGAIGLPVAINAAKSGLRVQVWNRSPEKCLRAVEHGALAASQLSEIDAHLVVSVLPDLTELEWALNAGLEESLKPGDLVVIMSTVSPVGVRELGQRLAAIKVGTIDAPVSGGDVGAWDASLSIMCGGEVAEIERCARFFGAVGSVVRHFGPLGSGEVVKAINQIVVASTLATLGEALNLARLAQLDVTEVIEVLEGGLAGSRALEVKREKFISQNYQPGGSATFQLKDLNFAKELGESLGAKIPITEQVRSLYSEMVAQGYGDLDHSGIASMSKNQ